MKTIRKRSNTNWSLSFPTCFPQVTDTSPKRENRQKITDEEVEEGRTEPVEKNKHSRRREREEGKWVVGWSSSPPPPSPSFSPFLAPSSSEERRGRLLWLVNNRVAERNSPKGGEGGAQPNNVFCCRVEAEAVEEGGRLAHPLFL